MNPGVIFSIAAAFCFFVIFVFKSISYTRLFAPNFQKSNILTKAKKDTLYDMSVSFALVIMNLIIIFNSL